MAEYLTKKQIIEELAKRGYKLTEDGLYRARKKLKDELNRYYVGVPKSGQFALYLPEAVDVLERYCRNRDEWLRKRKENKKTERDYDPQFTKPQPKEVVERRLAELKKRWPNTEERVFVWLNALTALTEEDWDPAPLQAFRVSRTRAR